MMKRDAVILLVPTARINGACLDAFDYWMALVRGGADIRLYLIGLGRRAAFALLRDRYGATEAELRRVKFRLFRLSLGRDRFGRVLCGYATFRRIHPWLRADVVHVLPSQRMRRDAEHGRIRLGGPEVTFWLDPLQHRYAVPHRRDYAKRIYLDGLRHPAASDACVLVNCVSEHKRHPAAEIRAALGPEGARDAVRVLAYGWTRPYREAGFEVLRPPVPDLFARFDRYLYLPALGGYDENPRLLIESVWLGKVLILPHALPLEDGAAIKLARLQQDPAQFRLQSNDPLLTAMGGLRAWVFRSAKGEAPTPARWPDQPGSNLGAGEVAQKWQSGW